MEMYELILKHLASQQEMSLSIEVDEAETTENIIIRALINAYHLSKILSIQHSIDNYGHCAI